MFACRFHSVATIPSAGRIRAPQVYAHSEDAEIRQLKRELARVTEERDILKKRPRISPGMQSAIRVGCRASAPVWRTGDVSVPARSAQRLLSLTDTKAQFGYKPRPDSSDGTP